MTTKPNDKAQKTHAQKEKPDIQPFPFIPTGSDNTLKKVFGLEDEDDKVLPNPRRQERDNKPS